MKKKRIVGMIIVLIFILLMGGCKGNKIIDQTTKDQEQENLTTTNPKRQYKKITLDQLEEKLMESIGIELKSTENNAIGYLEKREEIIRFVEDLFEYPKQEEFPNDSLANEVVGPLNFYFSNDDDIYGLVKNNYIYIEGYYFLITDSQVKTIETLFKNRMLETPVSEN